MLVDIIKGFLKINTEQAANLLHLLALDKHWHSLPLQKYQSWEGFETQHDVIEFLEMVGQKAWFYGHDRSLFPNTNLPLNVLSQYFNAFCGMGLTQTRCYHEAVQPEYAVVLGSTAPQMQQRIQTLSHDLIRGIRPRTNIIFGLGSHRPLGVSSVDLEATAIQMLLEQRRPVTEMQHLNFLMETALNKINMLKKTPQLMYWPVETSSSSQSRLDPHCIKTIDAATSLRMILEREFEIKSYRVTNVAVYSNQPYVLRQQRDVQAILTGYKVIGVGEGINQDNFYKNPKSIAIMLGEVARLIHLQYQVLPKHLQTKLTPPELTEIKTLLEPLLQHTSTT